MSQRAVFNVLSIDPNKALSAEEVLAILNKEKETHALGRVVDDLLALVSKGVASQIGKESSRYHRHDDEWISKLGIDLKTLELVGGVA